MSVTGAADAGGAADGVVAAGTDAGLAVPGDVTDVGPAPVTELCCATVVPARDAVELDLPASFTTATTSTASAIAATTATAMTGALQFVGDVAKRVRAAAPQRMHQSWSERSGAPHSGQ